MVAAGTGSACPSGQVATPGGRGARAKNSRPGASSLDTKSTAILVTATVVVDVVSVSNSNKLAVGAALDKVGTDYRVDRWRSTHNWCRQCKIGVRVSHRYHSITPPGTCTYRKRNCRAARRMSNKCARWRLRSIRTAT